MATIRHIAEVCNVSVATVSKALNNYTDIGAETKERVLAAAKEYGYIPHNPGPSKKSRKRTHQIGVLFEEEANSGLKHDFLGAVVNSFKRVIEDKGYELTFIHCVRSSSNNKTLLEHCKYRNFDGVFIASTDFSNPEIIELVHSGIPVVTLGYAYKGYCCVVSDPVRVMFELMQYIYDCGHRRIAFVHGESSAASTKARLANFCKAAKELKISIPDEYLAEGRYRDIALAKRLTEQLLKLPVAPTCILYPDDYATLGGISAIKSFDLKIPQDISIVGYDGIELGRMLEPKLATVEQNTAQIGRISATEIICQIENPDMAVRAQILVPANVYEGESIRRLSVDCND